MRALIALVAGITLATNAHATLVATASSTEGEGSDVAAANAVDGNPATRWSSAFHDREWITVDYGDERDLVGITLHWEAASAQKYTVELSSDGKNWRTVYREDEGRGGVEDIYFGRQQCRYLKLQFHQRASAWGYSLWEIVTKGLDQEILATASSSSRGHDPEQILDGDPSSFWKPATNGPAWIALNFPRARIIAGVSVKGAESPERDWHLELSRDGTNWFRAGEWRRDADLSSCLIGKASVSDIRLVRDGGSAGLGKVGILSWEDVAAASSLEIIRGLAGIEGSATKVHVGRDGSFVAEPHDGQVGTAVYDRDADVLYTPETMATDWSLEDGRLPFNDTRWRASGLAADTVIFAENYNGHELTYARTVLSNATDRARRVTLLVTVRPSGINAERAKALHKVARRADDRLVMNGEGVVRVQWPEGHAPAKPRRIEALGIRVLGISAFMEFHAPTDCAAAGRDVELAPGQAVACTVWVPSGPVDDPFEFPDVEERHAALREEWLKRVPVVLNVPDKRYADLFYSSAYYLLLLSTKEEIWPGPVNYRTFFLHDSAEEVEALDKAGIHDVPERMIRRFQYNKTDNYLDGLGGLAYSLYIHYALTKDRAYLEEAYPRIRQASETIRDLRKDEASSSNHEAALAGLMPPSASQDNFNKHAHLYQDNWWSCVGLRAGALAAQAQNETNDAQWMNAECDSLLAASLASIRAVMKREKIDYAPAFADVWPHEDRVVDADHRILGEAQMASAHRPLLSPGVSLGLKPPVDLFANSYRTYWKRAGSFSGYDGAWFVEYEKVFWGYNLQLARPLPFLGLNDIALLNLKWSVENPSCPGAWMEAMKSRRNAKGLYELAPGIIGDVPHGWVAAHYMLLLRDMLAREEGNVLHLLACVPPEWFADGKTIELRNAPTMFGLLDFTAKSEADRIRIHMSAEQSPPGGWILTLPRSDKIAKILVDGNESAAKIGRDLRLEPTAHDVEIVYR